MTRIARITGPAVLLLVAFVSVLVALLIGGAADAPAISDPGAVVRFGLPIARLVLDLSAAATIGGLGLTVVGLSRSAPEWNRAIDVTAASAGIWTVAAAATTFLTFLSVAGVSVGVDAQFGQTLAVFLTGTDLGLAWIVAVLVAAVVTVLCFAVRSRGMVAVTAGVAMIGLVPLAQQGHAAGTASHDAAVTALGLHLVGAALWVGGLLLLVLVRDLLPAERIAAVVGRYSSIALGCFVLVAVSGYASAAIRIGAWGGLLSPYGVLVLVKVAAILAIGVLGVVQRRRTIRALAADPRRRGPFWTLVVVELAVMGIASGFAAALARTATPVDQIALSKTSDPTPAELLTDDSLPHAPGPWTWVTGWDIDLLWLLLAVLLVGAYIAGVVRLRRRGERWPVSRIVAAGACVLVLLVATNGWLHLYDRFLISTNIAAHLLLGLAVPVLANAAAPVRLIRTAVDRRDDDSTGVREWTGILVDNAAVRYLSQPFPAVVLLAGVWWAYIDTQALRWSTSDGIGRTVVDVVFLIVGLVAVPTLLRPVAAGARRPSGSAAYRIGGAVIVGASLVGLGVALRGPLGLVDAGWFGAMGRTWGPEPLVDQAHGGVVLIVTGIAFAALVAVVSWTVVRRDRESARPDVADLAVADPAGAAGTAGAAGMARTSGPAGAAGVAGTAEAARTAGAARPARAGDPATTTRAPR
ncbi:cytochrome c oxidase assembly protein [Curtobacterium sp. RRHDQ10]|uniref:cytochrome c oxidase assembly protein n=1 Tax=Curtobacterium phyllosphaerae TaxID=3413379 RepID=UPI003BF01468